jgi:hypothetical protein
VMPIILAGCLGGEIGIEVIQTMSADSITGITFSHNIKSL